MRASHFIMLVVLTGVILTIPVVALTCGGYVAEAIKFGGVAYAVWGAIFGPLLFLIIVIGGGFDK